MGYGIGERCERRWKWARAALCLAAITGCGEAGEPGGPTAELQAASTCTGHPACTPSQTLPGELTGYYPASPWHIPGAAYNAGPDYNQCVYNIYSSASDNVLTRLNPSPEMLAAHRPAGSIWVNHTDEDDDYHYQSVQRLPYFKDGSGAWKDLSRYLILQSSRDPSDGAAQIGFIYAGGSDPRSPVVPGERLRGNRRNTTGPDWDSSTLAWLPSLSTSLFEIPDPWLGAGEVHNHPSGSSTLGAHFIAALQHYAGLPYYDADGGMGTIAIYDLSGLPEGGTPSASIPVRSWFPLSDKGVDWASGVKLSDGTYLVMAQTDDGDWVGDYHDKLEIYRNLNAGQLVAPSGFSTATDVPTGSLYDVGTYHFPDGSRGGDWLAGNQSGQILTECNTGALYLVASGKGGNNVSLWRLRYLPSGTFNHDGKQRYSAYKADGTTPEDFSAPLASVHLECAPHDGADSTCAFNKAGGAYVDAMGRLLFYGARAANASGAGGDWFVRLGEFRYSDPQKITSSSAAGGCDLDHAFFELYDHKLASGGDGEPPSGSQSFIVDWPDRNYRSHDFATAYDFQNLALAARYCIPAGYKYVVHNKTVSAWGTSGDVATNFCGDSTVGCTGPVSSGSTKGFNQSGTSSNWASGCFMMIGSNPNVHTNCLNEIYMPGACTTLASAQQRFASGRLIGCAGHVRYDNRASLCGPGYHVATAAEYHAGRAFVFPTHDYWTDDALRYSGTGSNQCSVSTSVGGDCGADTPMRVCASTQPDAEGNACNWVNCGYGANTPNDYFGGCQMDLTAGTLCMSNW